MSRAEPRTTGEHICFAPQPRSVFGTPDTMVQRGVDGMLSETERLAEAIVRAVSGKTNAKAIVAAINGAAKRFGSASIAKHIERELLHATMLGALDSDHEATTGNPVRVESFAQLHGRFHLAFDTSFAARPIKEAIASFLKKKAVTRESFDAMTKDAQRRAFTVANAANEEMVRTVKRELLRQVAVGADFADFGKNAAKRFEAAGWVPANPSHVEIVFRTNVMGAYSGGRVRQMSDPAVLSVRPFWQSLPVGDGPPRQRPTHIMFVLRAADPFWQTCCCPYGYNCRCRNRSLSIKQGAGLVQEGTSIHGLPDPGFTSGVSTLFESGNVPSQEPPETPSVPATPPANDPPPRQKPANDPAPRQRPANDGGRPAAAIERDIADLRRQINNIIRRRKAVPQAEFDALRQRLTELMAELARARVAND